MELGELSTETLWFLINYAGIDGSSDRIIGEKIVDSPAKKYDHPHHWCTYPEDALQSFDIVESLFEHTNNRLVKLTDETLFDILGRQIGNDRNTVLVDFGPFVKIDFLIPFAREHNNIRIYSVHDYKKEIFSGNMEWKDDLDGVPEENLINVINRIIKDKYKVENIKCTNLNEKYVFDPNENKGKKVIFTGFKTLRDLGYLQISKAIAHKPELFVNASFALGELTLANTPLPQSQYFKEMKGKIDTGRLKDLLITNYEKRKKAGMMMKLFVVLDQANLLKENGYNPVVLLREHTRLDRRRKPPFNQPSYILYAYRHEDILNLETENLKKEDKTIN